ncbi:hypothetical protein [Polaromonas sp.]|uniref:hypothetical protein n=1 Tax=Polaromonas sp. TaxID=1869339 RepID=UPI003BB70A8D
MAIPVYSHGAAASPLLRLDMGHNTNWRRDAAPVAILNEASTLHERIAYCWGLAQQLLDLSEFLHDSQDPSVARVSGLFSNHLTPLANMLDHLGDSTRLSN